MDTLGKSQMWKIWIWPHNFRDCIAITNIPHTISIKIDIFLGLITFFDMGLIAIQHSVLNVFFRALIVSGPYVLWWYSLDFCPILYISTHKNDFNTFTNFTYTHTHTHVLSHHAAKFIFSRVKMNEWRKMQPQNREKILAHNSEKSFSCHYYFLFALCLCAAFFHLELWVQCTIPHSWTLLWSNEWTNF